ncbi:MAG: 7-carboxy-7-deazaguanine synthase QueE [Cytophagales bacterium]|nr:7-carboxy-7-deazaguanine synthase QueE [Armatimonadota bacterium]
MSAAPFNAGRPAESPSVLMPLKVYRGETPDPRQATRDAVAVVRRGLLPIVEIFYSLQGEGVRTGQATVFVRVAGCSLACSFCDTDFRVRREMTVDEIVDEVIGYGCPWVCLTGGEPTLFDLQPLCDRLHAHSFFLQIETNGQHPRPSWRLDHITVSPKESEGGHLHPWYQDHAMEFKVVIDTPADLERARAYPAAGHPGGPLLYLQPNALNPDAVSLCIEAVKADPTRLRLSLQTHKLLQIR